MDSPLFYKYYDTLFATKDYAGEVASVLEFCHNYPLQPLENVLELGCGTGNHTLELAKESGIRVIAVDTDEAMLALAAEKAAAARKTNITFAAGCQAVRNVDLCVALFNVVNYLCSDEQLHQFFAGIAASLRSQGLLIFDCWNGTAALQDPPGAKSYEQQIDGQKLSCHLTTRTDYVRELAMLDYSLELFAKSGKLIESDHYRIEHRLWTPARIKSALKEGGFDLLTVCIPFKFDIAATDADWKIMFACRKI
jgi:SAM-dependent methyltransferase